MTFIRQLVHLTMYGYVSLDNAFCICDNGRFKFYCKMITRTYMENNLEDMDILAAITFLNYLQRVKMITLRNSSTLCDVEKPENKFDEISEFALRVLESDPMACDGVRDLLRS